MTQSMKDVGDACIRALIAFIDKIASKKYAVWVIATHMAYIGLLDPQSWLVISLLYMGIEGGLDWKNFSAIIAASSRTTKQTNSTNTADTQVQRLSSEPDSIQSR